MNKSKLSSKFIIVVVIAGIIIVPTVISLFKKDIEKDMESTEEVESTVIDNFNGVGADIDDPNNDNSYSGVPIYYQDDYKEIAYKGSTIASCGNLVTCLSMIDSYYSSTDITPDKFIQMYPDSVRDNMIQDICKKDNIKYRGGTFDIDEVANYLLNTDAVILLRIDRPSELCSTSTYILLTGIKDEGNFIVRDPMKSNVDKISTDMTNTNEPIYSVSTICEAVGDNGTMYVFANDFSLIDNQTISEPIDTETEDKLELEDVTTIDVEIETTETSETKSNIEVIKVE